MHLTKLQRAIIKLTVVVILAIVLIRVYQPELALMTHPSPAHQHGLGDTLLLIATIAILCSIPFAPNAVVCIFTGVCFGPFIGFLINWCGNIIGNGFVAIMIRRSGISEQVRHKRAFDYLTRQRFPVVGLIIGFIVPVVPNLPVNYAANGMRVTTGKYLLAASLGTLPIAFIYALGGNAIFTMNFKKVVVVIALFVFLCMFYWGLKRLQENLST